MACEEACRLILNSDDYREMVVIGEVDDDDDVIEFDTLSHRAHTYSLLSDRSVPYLERLRAICRTYHISLDIHSDDAWRELLASLEYLDEEHKALFSCYSSSFSVAAELEKPLERALAYFIYRHCSSALDESEFRTALGFSLFCERLLASVAHAEKGKNMVELARILSEEIEYSEENTETIKMQFLF